MRRLIPVAALALAGCAPRTPAPRPLTSYMPPDAILLAGMRVEEVRATPLGKKLAAAASWEYSGVALEPRVLVASWDGRDWLVAVRGPYRPAAAPAGKYRGYTLYGGERGTVAAMDAGTALAGRAALVRAAIDRYHGTRATPAGLLARAATLPTPNQVWAVTYGAVAPPAHPAPRSPNLATLERLLQAMADLRFAADLRTGMNATLSGECLDENNARLVADAVRGMFGVGRALAGKDAGLARAWDGVKVDRRGKAVEIRAQFSETDVEKLAGSFLP